MCVWEGGGRGGKGRGGGEDGGLQRHTAVCSWLVAPAVSAQVPHAASTSHLLGRGPLRAAPSAAPAKAKSATSALVEQMKDVCRRATIK